MYLTKKISGNDIANIYQAENENGNFIEFVESSQPPYTFKDKLIIIVSALFGCPVNCGMCSAGTNFRGVLSREELLYQIDHVLDNRYTSRKISSDVLELRFARKGDPAYNMNIIQVLKDIPQRYTCKYLIPSLATIAPAGREEFFDTLLAMKKMYYADNFKLRFSIHSTDEQQRDKMLAVKKMNLQQISTYGDNFYDKNGNKITLFFAVNTGNIISADKLAQTFNPAHFRLHFSPVSPDLRSFSKDPAAIISNACDKPDLYGDLTSAGFEVSASYSEWEEEGLGINCRQFTSQQSAELKSSSANDKMTEEKFFNRKLA